MKARCVDNSDYETSLTLNKEYDVTEVEGIFKTCPYWEFLGDDGKLHYCHQYRIERIDK